MEKVKRLHETLILPEEVIQHIQSFMSGKQAAQSTLLSKSWHDAWLTRPTVDIDERDFFGKHPGLSDTFEEYAMKTMQRYQDLSMKIQSFRLRVSTYGDYTNNHDFFRNLIVKAMDTGAVDLKLEFPGLLFSAASFTLPKEVLRSETLLRLSASRCGIDGNNVSCSRLKSLSLTNLKNPNFGIISRCNSLEVLSLSSCILINSDISMISRCNSLEDLSLSTCPGLILSRDDLNELHNLSRLHLFMVGADNMFFTDFASRFPSLKDLTFHSFFGCSVVDIATASFQTISFKHCSYRQIYQDHKFDVPNIRKFVYEGYGDVLPSITGASKGFELDVSMHCNILYSSLWFQHLKMWLAKFRLSRISLSINIDHNNCSRLWDGISIEVEGEPVLLENLTIASNPSLCCDLLVRLFRICRPKFITKYLLPHECNSSDASFHVLYERLMHRVITPNCGIPDQYMFGQFNLKKVNMEVYERFDDTPQQLKTPLDATKVPKDGQKVRFELIWDQV